MIESEYRSWQANPDPEQESIIIKSVKQWQSACENAKFYDLLCKAYLLQIRILLGFFHLEEIESAKDHDILKYQQIAKQQSELFLSHKDRITQMLSKDAALTPEEQEEVFAEYIKQAIQTMDGTD